MSDKGSGGAWPAITEFFRSFGLGGSLVAGGAVIAGLALYKGPDLKDVHTQSIVVLAGLVVGVIVLGIGVWQLLRDPVAAGKSGKPASGAKYAVYIAAPMAGFGNDDAGRKQGTELVSAVQAALQKLLPGQSIYAAPLVRPDPGDFETPGAAFNREREALHASERYVLVVPPVFPAGTSVLMTVGMAIEKDLLCLVLAPQSMNLPYLLQGAKDSKDAKLSVALYTDIASVKHLFDNNGLTLFGGDDA
jgi:hypothetical protein